MGDDRVPPGTLSYFQARNRQRIYEIVIDAFVESGLSQADLARRLGKGNDQVCRWLGAPGNWGLDTASDLMFAICGGELEYHVGYPLDQPKRNMRRPEWADAPLVTISVAANGSVPQPANFIRWKNVGPHGA